MWKKRWGIKWQFFVIIVGLVIKTKIQQLRTIDLMWGKGHWSCNENSVQLWLKEIGIKERIEDRKHHYATIQVYGAPVFWVLQAVLAFISQKRCSRHRKDWYGWPGAWNSCSVRCGWIDRLFSLKRTEPSEGMRGICKPWMAQTPWTRLTVSLNIGVREHQIKLTGVRC